MMIRWTVFVFLLPLIDCVLFSLDVIPFRIEIRRKTLYAPDSIVVVVVVVDRMYSGGGALKVERYGPVIVA